MVAVSLLLTSFILSSSEPLSREEILELDLAELLKLEVTISSTKSEAINATPAVVSRYQAKDLASFGLTSLADFLDFVPGIVIQDTAIGTKSIMIRGVVEAFNQKVLFLLNGVPYWQPSHGDNAILGLGIEHIDRIEVIRGPGSVNYGTNASGGVINVILKNDTDSSAFVAKGANDLSKAGFYHGQEISDDSILTFSAEYQDDDGYQGLMLGRPVPPFYPPDTPQDGRINKQHDFKNFYLSYQAPQLELFVHKFDSLTNGVAAIASIINRNDLEYDGLLLHGKYTWQHDQFTWRSFFDYNRFFLTIPTDNLFAGTTDGVQNFGDGKDNVRLRGELQLEVAWNESWSGLFGLEYESREIGLYRNTVAATGEIGARTMEPDANRETALYGLIDYQDAKWRYQVGMRYIDNESAGENLTPRMSFVYPIDEFQSIKFLYGVGFNSPNHLQQGINIPPDALLGTPDLEAETVTTYDIAYTYSHDNFHFVANAYWLKAKDFILRVPQADGTGIEFANGGSFSRNGIELDLQYAVPNWRVFSNLAYQQQGDSVILDDFTAQFVPKITFNIGASYAIWGNARLGLGYRHISERTIAEAQDLLNLNLNFHVSKWQVDLSFNNVLEESQLNSAVQDFNPNSLIQGGDNELTWLVKLSYRFE